MDSANSILINRFFTRNTFKQLVDDGECAAYTAAIRRYIVDSTGKTNGECVSEIYQFLKNITIEFLIYILPYCQNLVAKVCMG